MEKIAIKNCLLSDYIIPAKYKLYDFLTSKLQPAIGEICAI